MNKFLRNIGIKTYFDSLIEIWFYKRYTIFLKYTLFVNIPD